MKGWKEMLEANGNQENLREAILISDKMTLKQRL